MATTIATPIVRFACCAGACAVLVVLTLLVGAPGRALAGGDEEGQAPPSAGPPGPWKDSEVGEGEDVPYRPTDARSCRLRKVRRAGPGSVLGMWVVGTRCRTGRRVVARYQDCLNSENGRKGGCYGRVDKRCVRPVFLGRCWHARPLLPAAGRWAIAAPSGGCMRSRASMRDTSCCRQGRRRISHGYTLLGEAPVAVDTESELRAAWANPRVTAIDVTADISLRACERGDPMRESGRPMLLDGHGHTLRQTCFEKRLLRQDGTGFVELRNVTLTRGGSDGPGAAVTTRGEIMVVDSKVAAEPRRGAGRRDHVAAPRDDRALGDHREPGQRRRRRRLRAPRRRAGV